MRGVLFFMLNTENLSNICSYNSAKDVPHFYKWGL